MAAYDILMVADLRLTGGAAATLADEVRAQSAAGYRTGLLHMSSSVPAPLRAVAGPVARVIDDRLADVVLPGDRARATHAFVRHSGLATALAGPVARALTVDGVSVIAGGSGRNDTGRQRYNPVSVTEAVFSGLGHKPVWRPTSGAVRRQLAEYAERGEIDLAPSDWSSVIDVGAWVSDRRRGVRGVPVLGRYGGGHPSVWPRSAEDILGAYPDTAGVRVRILGDVGPAAQILGTVPKRWLVEPFDSRNPVDFLAELDFFVCFHHADLVETDGRGILEALASGAVTILPPHFKGTFGDAAVYAAPHEVADVVGRLSGDPSAYAKQSASGREYAADRRGYAQHVARLAEIAGAPAGAPADTPAGSASPVANPRRTSVGPSSVRGAAGTASHGMPDDDGGRARVLFMSSNGTGMGHLTRLLAMANRAGDRIEPFFFSMSSAVPVVARYGYSWEYCPSRDDLDVTAKEWNPFFTARFTEIVRRFRPLALVFDGTWPYRGMGEVKERFPDLHYIWSRRAMWKEGHRTDPLEKSAWFDLVIEPGEFAAPLDRGPTVDMTDAHRVGPVTLLDRPDVLSREAARAELGIDPDEKTILVTLGSGNDTDYGPDLDAIARAVSRRPGWQVYATRAPIARSTAAGHADVRTISPYPLSRSLPAFDIAVVACGYNAYHEAILAGVPTIFVPKPKVTDDQPARARYADQVGVGVAVDDVSVTSIDAALDRLVVPAERDRIHARCLELYPENGAGEATALVEQLLERKGVIV